MTDIVEILRSVGGTFDGPASEFVTCADAADEIERLRAEIAGFQNLSDMRQCMVDTADENSGLVKQLAECQKEIERTNRTAHCGTVDSFLQLSDEDKRKWFVLALRESEARKKAEDALEECQKDAARYRWLRDVGDITWEPMAKRAWVGAAGIDDAIDVAMENQHD